MAVIEVDGVYVQPYVTEGVDLAVGQRYSVLVKMHADPARNYPIVAVIASGSPRPNAMAWLQYDSSSALPPAQGSFRVLFI